VEVEGPFYTASPLAVDNEGRTELHRAFIGHEDLVQQLALVQALLVAHPETDAVRDSDGWVPLHAAMCSGAFEEVVVCILVHTPNEAEAIGHGLRAVIRLGRSIDTGYGLLEEGDLKVQFFNFLCLCPAAAATQDHTGCFSLHEACSGKYKCSYKARYEIVKALLSASPACSSSSSSK